MSIKRRIGFGLLGLLGLLVVAGVVLWVWKPWVPAVVVTDPGPDGRRIDTPGLFANYYRGRGAGRRPAVLIFGGSEGGIGANVTRDARALAAEGYAVLNISYFRAPGQSKAIVLIPLEGFTRALDWLRQQLEVDPSRLAVMGASKGGEAALLVATRHPELKAVVAGMPSSVAWAGYSWETFGSKESSWSENGRPVPFLPYGKADFGKGFSLLKIYQAGLATLPQHPDAIIPIERSGATVLLICGKADTLWPSCPMAYQIHDRAVKNGHPVVTVLAYPDAGHAVQGLPEADGNKDFDGLGSLGGSATGNNAARRDGWPKTLAFLKAAFGSA